MSKYAIIFSNDKDKKYIKLPVNPEEIEVNTSQTIGKFEILKLGQIAIPTHMELREFSFEAELPHEKYQYVEAGNDFHTVQYCLDQFKKWRDELIPVRFMAGKATSDNTVKGDSINTLVLIENLTITEKAGEEQDKYVSFRLIEYKKYEKSEKKSKPTNNPNKTEYYVVKPGDCLYAIARKYYNDGTKYIKIFNANKNIISNPALIYPGQRLVIPK